MAEGKPGIMVANGLMLALVGKLLGFVILGPIVLIVLIVIVLKKVL